MISKECINRIMDTVRIEEVVSEFVTLKRRGSNLTGLCPFHNEKTPSFNVSPSRNIFKCFGCGKAGNAVTFIMEHEHYTYPEALRFLASKYNIEVEETHEEENAREEELERESLFLLNEFACRYYSDYLLTSDEGRSIGLSYLRERGFRDDIIRGFQLGMAPDKKDGLLQAALSKGYTKEQLIKAGLIAVKENDGDGHSSYYDRFRNRIIFPVHNLTGKVIGFGARLIKNDPKSPKYLNSPETEIYNKSKILYGIHFAKKAISEKDECFLVEGYTDVISLHSEGFSNVVASSGTSLTADQIRLIARFTHNITILYDGDAAGIKASLRGIDMILEQGMNVRVVLFPEGHDPDSFVKKHSHTEVHRFIRENKKDFITFKTGLLLSESGSDPIARSGLIRDVVESIAKIPDSIMRETYIRQCSSLLEISEQTLIFEVNKIRRKQFEKAAAERSQPEALPERNDTVAAVEQTVDTFSSSWQEAEIIRLLINYFDCELSVTIGSENRDETRTMRAGEYILAQLQPDEIEFEEPLYRRMFEMISEYAAGFDPGLFINHEDAELRMAATGMLTDRYHLHDWQRTGIFVKTETDVLSQQVLSAVYILKTRKLMKLLRENNEQIRQASSEGRDVTELVKERMALEDAKREMARHLGIVILK